MYEKTSCCCGGDIGRAEGLRLFFFPLKERKGRRMKVRLLGVPQGRRVTFLLPVGECDPARRHREIAYKAKDLLQGFGREIGGIMRADFFFLVFIGRGKKGNGGGQSRDCVEGE